MNKQKNKQAKEIMSSLTTLTALIHTVSIIVGIAFLIESSIHNDVSYLISSILIFLINIPIWNLSRKADKWRGL